MFSADTLSTRLDSSYNLYADDTQLFFFCPPYLDLSITRLQNDLQQIFSWMNSQLL